jgi:ubiquinone/menaquinone biosynthesis C-methylase UbiE
MASEYINVHETEMEREGKWRSVSNLVFKVGDGCSLPLPDRSSDFVYSYEAFQHMPSDPLISANLGETAKIVRAGGYTLLHFRTRGWHFDLDQVYRDIS